jgi:hypothetical protein
MTRISNFWFPGLLLCVLLSGCSRPPALERASTGEAELFANGLDHYIESGDLQTLKRLPQEYPYGEWRPRAESLIALVEQQKELQAQWEEKEKMRQAPAEDKALAQCQHEMDLLTQKNQMLEETLERLKQLLIDMELRSN